MRIGVVLRDLDETARGGDLVQGRAICRHLKDLGHEVEPVAGHLFDPKNWDACILFNLSLLPGTALAAQRCASSSIPYLIFPVFWDLRVGIPAAERRAISRLLPTASRRRLALSRASYVTRRMKPADVIRSTRLLSRSDRRLANEVIGSAAAVYPNSEAEADHLAAYLQRHRDGRWRVIRNGIWAAEMPAGLPWSRRTEEVICLGGVSPRKNSLTLVRAAKMAGVSLKLIGSPGDRSDPYVRRVMTEAADSVTIDPWKDRDDVLQALGAVKAHAQVGFVETPGLATLEAVGAGANVVVAATPIVREYLGSEAVYVDPNSVEAVAEGLIASLSSPPSEAARKRVLRDYDWGHVLAPVGADLGLLA